MYQTEARETYKRDWRTALSALRKLLKNGDDTSQVFIIMRALNGAATPKNYGRLLRTEAGARLAYERVELAAERFSDPALVASYAPGTVGAAYRDWLAETGYSAEGLAEVSNLDKRETPIPHPYAWFGRRTRDVHDVWHVITGYKADETMGEAALVAFSYAQTKGMGWALIAVGAALKSIRETGGTLFAKAVLEGYRLGKRANWLLGEDYEALMHEPLDAARRRLNIGEPVAYKRAQRELGAELASYASRQKAALA
ncbi:Coq4 family protein [Sphingomonas lenta]|uniref:Ubiquinone biosynthesis protein n=1 Tax=Sphingomonas lenta TaxID=1141887 RepID=A0A2A2SEC1_9SPHN|nr:Coq4 family protein [Sphingomonas lenta]PAX07607.1 ubiquinone biosynthesis protein [Sphingomonas lenta]